MGSSSIPERMLSNLDQSHGWCSHTASCSRLSSRVSGARTPTGSSSTTQCGPGTRSAISVASFAADADIQARLGADELAAIFDLSSTVEHVDTVFERLTNAFPPRTPHVSESGSHLASGKVREISALDSERLRLVASDRISTFDVVLATEIPDKGRVLTGLSAFWFTQTASDRPEPSALACPGRTNHGVQAARDAPDRVRRPGLPRRLRMEGLSARRCVCGHALPDGLRESERLPEPIFTPATKATTGHDENIDRSAATELVGEERFAEVERTTIELYRFASEHAARCGSSSPTRSSSSGSTRRAPSSSPTRPSRPTRLDSGRPRSTGPAPPRRRSTSNSSVTTVSRWAGTRARRGPCFPRRWSRAARKRYIEAFEL